MLQHSIAIARISAQGTNGKPDPTRPRRGHGSFVLLNLRTHVLIAATAGIFAYAVSAPAQTPAITMNGAVTIVESAQEPSPLHRATQDLRADFTKVFGQAPKLVSSLELGRTGGDPDCAARQSSRRSRLHHHAEHRGLCLLHHFRWSRSNPEARSLSYRRGHARHHLRHLRVLAASPRHGSDVPVD